MFLPQQALNLLPESFRWRGYPLGKASRGEVRVSPRMRCMMPPADQCAAGALNVEEPELISGLLSGQSIDLARGAYAGSVDASLPEAGLYFRGLPLGRLRIKGRRALWAER
jgi:16S rRNA (cytosine1407-C5)-methyltransferase